MKARPSFLQLWRTWLVTQKETVDVRILLREAGGSLFRENVWLQKRRKNNNNEVSMLEGKGVCKLEVQAFSQDGLGRMGDANQFDLNVIRRTQTF